MSRAIKVLIVDDSNVILNSLKTFFEGYSFEVLTCEDGLEGLKITAEEKPDIVFLDLMMPNFDGIKMLQAKSVFNEIKNIPVVVISGNTLHSNVMAAMEAGASKIISKPIDNLLLKEAVNEILGGNFFSKQVEKRITPEKQLEIQDNLLKIFLDTFPEVKHKIAESLRNRDSEKLKAEIHKLKGSGSTVGLPEITKLSQEIMLKQFTQSSDWVFAEIKTSQIFRKIEEIKKEIRKTVI